MDAVHFIPKATIFSVLDWILFLDTRGVGFHTKHANSQSIKRACLNKVTAGSLLKGLDSSSLERQGPRWATAQGLILNSLTPHCTESWKPTQPGLLVFRWGRSPKTLQVIFYLWHRLQDYTHYLYSPKTLNKLLNLSYSHPETGDNNRTYTTELMGGADKSVHIRCLFGTRPDVY